jgi:hypothetical protein
VSGWRLDRIPHLWGYAIELLDLRLRVDGPTIGGGKGRGLIATGGRSRRKQSPRDADTSGGVAPGG